MGSHNWHDCKVHGCSPSPERCMFCRGGLAACVTCGGGEGSLPTHCPGRPMSTAEQDRVYAGELDFDAQGQPVRMREVQRG